MPRRWIAAARMQVGWSKTVSPHVSESASFADASGAATTG